MRTQVLKVKRMTGGGSVTAIASALKALEGVKEIVVSLSLSQATVKLDESGVSLETLRAAVRAAGFHVDETA